MPTHAARRAGLGLTTTQVHALHARYRDVLCANTDALAADAGLRAALEGGVAALLAAGRAAAAGGDGPAEAAAAPSAARLAEHLRATAATAATAGAVH